MFPSLSLLVLHNDEAKAMQRNIEAKLHRETQNQWLILHEFVSALRVGLILLSRAMRIRQRNHSHSRM